MAVEQSTKVTATHLNRKAYIYVRQSSPHQVVEHQESGRRQYELRQRAIAMGWSEEQVEVIDSDQAKSATRAGERIPMAARRSIAKDVDAHPTEVQYEA